MLSRREFVGLVGAGAAVSLAGTAQAQSGHKRLFAYIGSITAGGWGVGGGGGISVHTVDLADGSLTKVSGTGPEFDNVAAGYHCISPDGRYLYACNETKGISGEAVPGGRVLSFAIDPADGSLRFLNMQPSMASQPAYVAIDSTGSRVLAANHATSDYSVRVVESNGRYALERQYDNATVAVFPVGADGSLAYASDVAVLEQLREPPRQDGPHAHCVNLDPTNRMALVCDKGSDRLYTYEFDRENGALRNPKHFAVKPGAVPRHNAFHPTLPFVFVIHEAESIISAYRYDADSRDLDLVNTLSTLPQGFDGTSSPADVQVHPDGRFLFGSNRGHDSIAVFAIDQKTGELGAVDRVPSGGNRPRCLRVDPTGDFLFAGNRGSNSVVSFRFDRRNGQLRATGSTADVPRPACINFLWL